MRHLTLQDLCYRVHTPLNCTHPSTKRDRSPPSLKGSLFVIVEELQKLSCWTMIQIYEGFMPKWSAGLLTGAHRSTLASSLTSPHWARSLAAGCLWVLTEDAGTSWSMSPQPAACTRLLPPFDPPTPLDWMLALSGNLVACHGTLCGGTWCVWQSIWRWNCGKDFGERNGFNVLTT